MEELPSDNVDNNEVDSSDRAMLFQVHIQNIFKDIACGVSLDTFKHLFGEILNNKTSLIERLYTVYTEQLYKQMMEEMQLKEFIVEENLAEKFQTLSKLTPIETLEKNAVAWRPVTGDINQQIQSHDMEAKFKFKKELEEYVLAKEACVEHLKRKVSALRSKVRRLDDDIVAMSKVNEESFSIYKQVANDVLSCCVDDGH